MVCRKCGNETPEGSAFCRKCGTPVVRAEEQVKKNLCKKCGYELAEGSMFCNKCGTPCGAAVIRQPSQQPEEAPAEGKARIVLISILCVILILPITVLLLSSLILGNVVRSEGLPKAISDIQLEEVIVTDDAGYDLTLAEYLLDHYIDDETVTEDQVERVLKKGTFGKEAGRIAAQYNNYLIGKTSKFPKIDEDTVLEIIDNNAALIEQETGLPVYGENREELRRNLAEPVKDLNNAMRAALRNGAAGFGVRSAVSVWFPSVLGALLLLLLICLIVIRLKGRGLLGSAFKILGITALIPSLLVLVSGLFVPWALDRADMSFLTDQIKFVQSPMLIIGGIAAAVCILFIVIGSVWNKAKKRSEEPAPAMAVSYDRTAAPDAPREIVIPEENS